MKESGCVHSNRKYIILIAFLALACILLWALLLWPLFTTHGFRQDHSQSYYVDLSTYPEEEINQYHGSGVLSQKENMDFVRLGNYEVQLPLYDADYRNVVFLRSGRAYCAISLDRLKDKFLRDKNLPGGRDNIKFLREENWPGGHGKANNIRDSKSPGLILHITNARPAGKNALALMLWSLPYQTGDPVVREDLVQIRTGPMPSVELVRNLYNVFPGNVLVYADCPLPRIFKMGDRLILYNLPDLEEIDQEGTKIKTLAVIPDGLVPIGLLDSQWLILTEDLYASDPRLRYINLRQITHAKLIPGGWNHDVDRVDVYIPASGRKFMLSNDSKTYVITMPSGKSEVSRQ